MRGHIVRAFQCVFVMWFVFGNDDVEMAFQIAAYIRADIFIDGEGGGCVLDEKMQEPDFEGMQVG